MSYLDPPVYPVAAGGSVFQMLSTDELREIPAPQRVVLRNMLAERLRRQPPPSAEEIQGIKDLAAQFAKLPEQH